MKFIREDALERTFSTMLNKLIFARNEVLLELRNSISKESHRNALHEMNEVEMALENNREQQLTLTTISTEGYLDPTAYTRMKNTLFAENARLQERKEHLMRDINVDIEKTEALRKIINFTNRTEMLTDFDAQLFRDFVEKVTVHSRDELTFHLKCGLNLRERIQ